VLRWAMRRELVKKGRPLGKTTGKSENAALE